MLWTILVGFILTVLILGCYSNSKFRTRNYKVSLWHYWMASADSSSRDTFVPPETNHNGDSLSPKGKEDPIEMDVVRNASKEKETDQEENQSAIKSPETPETPEKPEKPENDSQQPISPMEHDTNTTQQIEGPHETPQDGDGNEPMNTSGSESGAKSDPNKVTEKPDDTKNSSDSGGEWKTVENSKTSPKKSGKKEEKGAKMSPKDRGLRINKSRVHCEWEKFVDSLSKELQKLMGGYWATEDTERYLDGYPKAKDHKDYNLNIEFYQNVLPSSPNGDLVEGIHEGWFGAYDHLEQHHGYIQWLFPIQEQGLNHMAQPLQKHEIQVLKKDKDAMKRLIKSYELMLDFFGMKLVDRDSGKIGRSDKSQKQQYKLLNYSFHNYLRITRILKCLGEFGFEHYQAQFCTFVISEIFEHGELKNTLKSCLSYWGKVIKDLDNRKEFYSLADNFVKADLAKKGGVVRSEMNKFF